MAPTSPSSDLKNQLQPTTLTVVSILVCFAESMFCQLLHIDTGNRSFFGKTRQALLRKCRTNALLIRSEHAPRISCANLFDVQFVMQHVTDAFFYISTVLNTRSSKFILCTFSMISNSHTFREFVTQILGLFHGYLLTLDIEKVANNSRNATDLNYCLQRPSEWHCLQIHCVNIRQKYSSNHYLYSLHSFQRYHVILYRVYRTLVFNCMPYACV